MSPRQALDAAGQRLHAILFRGIVSLDENLEPTPDLSGKWRLESGGKTIRFPLRSDLTDHEGRGITSPLILRCMRSYFFGDKPSPFAFAFPLLREIRLEKDDLIFELSAPDPYFIRNLSVVRYFATDRSPDAPCEEPQAGERIVTNGLYSVPSYPERFNREILLLSRDKEAPHLRFTFIRDETSRLLKLMNGEGDVVMNSFSPNKTVWITQEGKGFNFIERTGTNVSYLAFNLKDPILSRPEVRRAISYAIDRSALTKNKLRDQASPASSLLLPTLPEALAPQPFPYDPGLSEKILDQAGFPRGTNGVRFTLKHKTTASKEGLELSQFFKGMLAKVGIEIELDPVEPAVFYATIRKGHYQMHMGRWIGVSDGSILYRSLHSSSRDNRASYSNPEVDSLLDKAMREIDEKKRRELLIRVQERVLVDLPYFPLWHWTNALVIRNELTPLAPEALSLSGGYLPLTKLRFAKDPAVRTR
jgi:peptide/nickel transport system substrate-binding protein